jgi:hypothetical protein
MLTKMHLRIQNLMKTKITVEISKVFGFYPKNELEEYFG